MATVSKAIGHTPVFLASVCLFFLASLPVGAVDFDWEAGPVLPVASAGHSAAFVGNTLLMVGGSGFEISPWQGGEKQWYDKVYARGLGGPWVEMAALPQPRAYAAAAAAKGSLWIVGGTDGVTFFDDALRIFWQDNCWQVETWHNILPTGLAFMGGAQVGDALYLVGGQVAADSTEAWDGAGRVVFSETGPRFEALPPFPGTPGILSQCAGAGDGFYVFGGAALLPDTASPGKATRRYLDEAWRYSDKGGWEKLAPMPHPQAAGAAVLYGANHILLPSGDRGLHFAETAALGDEHPGFPREIWAYHTLTDAWLPVGEAPEGLVTAPALVYDETLYLVGGEDRPGHRSGQLWKGTLAPRGSALNVIDYLSLGGYFCILAGIGFYFARREKTTEIYFLGGRNIPWWAVGLSIFGTSLSAITYLSIPAQAFATNWVWAIANLGIVFVAPVVALYYVPRYRQYSIQTAYEFLEQRFNLATRIYGSLCFFTFQMGRVGIVMLLPSIALSATTGIDIYYAILAMGILTTIYTVLGGIEAVIWTDVLQAVVLVLGAIFALILIIARIDGGVPELVATASAADKFHFANWTLDMTTTALWVVVVGNALSNLYPQTADQTIVQRYLSTADTKSAQRAVWTNALLTIPITVIFFGLGTALWVYFRSHPELLDPRLQNDAILPLFIVEEFPIGLRGIVIAGVFAAAMSSLDSSINSVSSVLVNDYYRRFRPRLSERNAMRAARIITLVFGAFGTLAALYVARYEATSLWAPFLQLLSLVGGGLSGIFALGVFTTRANGAGAIAAAIASTAAVYYAQGTPVHFFLHAGIGFLTAVVVGYGVSVVWEKLRT